MRPLVLLVDDEPDILELLAMTLAQMEMDAECVPNLATAFARLKEKSFAFCLADMRLPDGDGIGLVTHIQEHYPQLPIAVITAYGNIEGAVNTLKAGAFDYVSKPVNLQVLRRLVKTALSLSRQNSVITHVTSPMQGVSPQIQLLRKQIEKVARSQAPVFIRGDSGTGKELVAKMIHQQGPRQDKPFVPVNCGAVPMELMESEFFGHKKGTFTGATADKQGLFQAAEGGTLFLDEVADLPFSMQVKLLRAIQEKAIRPLGASREIPMDVRVLSASHYDLEVQVKQGLFREDLYYRINVIELTVPRLCEMPQDIPILASAILSKLSSNDSPAFTLSEEALNNLCKYTFPGNVRELENILERAVALCEGHKIENEDLQLREIQIADENIKSQDEPLETTLDNTERELIEATLERCKWNRTLAAQELGLTLRQLRYRMQKFKSGSMGKLT